MQRAGKWEGQAISGTLLRQGIPSRSVSGEVRAYVNHGRWVADCAGPDCGGAELVIEGVPMTCGSCGRVREVSWPDEADVIESVLSERPRHSVQNWRAETVEQLRVENERWLHGLD